MINMVLGAIIGTGVLLIVVIFFAIYTIRLRNLAKNLDLHTKLIEEYLKTNKNIHFIGTGKEFEEFQEDKEAFIKKNIHRLNELFNYP